MPDDALEDDTWFVDSRAVGAGIQARPCGDSKRPDRPPPSDDPIAGGG
jgi:NTE family protein